MSRLPRAGASRRPPPEQGVPVRSKPRDGFARAASRHESPGSPMVRSRRLTRHRHSSDSARLQLARRAQWIVLAGSITGFTMLMGSSMDAARLLRDLVFYNLPYLATAGLCWWAPTSTRSSRWAWRLLARRSPARHGRQRLLHAHPGRPRRRRTDGQRRSPPCLLPRRHHRPGAAGPRPPAPRRAHRMAGPARGRTRLGRGRRGPRPRAAAPTRTTDAHAGRHQPRLSPRRSDPR